MGAVVRVPVERALISVHDKTGLIEFASTLGGAGVEIVSSGGTAAALEAAGLAVVRVEAVTGAAEMLGGRVKTLHPSIHGGILANLGDPNHRADLEGRAISPFQLVVVNLYPFEETVGRAGVTEAEAIEQIDIGGPAMVRAAAKNHAWVGVVTDPGQYDEVGAAVTAGGLDADLRRRLAAAAFFRTASYDAAIVEWLHPGDLPERAVVALERQDTLRYGENPHQGGASYRQVGRSSWWADAILTQGKAMSFNNHLDAEAAWRLVNRFEEPAVVIVKHTNPCGVAIAESAPDAYARAWECDPLSAFGGVVGINRPLDADTARQIVDRFVEVVVATAVEESAAAILAAKPNLRVLVASPPAGNDVDFRRVEGGFVAQPRDSVGGEEWTVVSERRPSETEMTDLRFAWTVAVSTKSNAIVVAAGGAAVGVGAGDQSRVGAAERALARAGARAQGAVAASDAFFPFPDGPEALAAAGVTAIIEPGGSVRDDEVIAAADAAGVALVFTGRRHFLH
jgi:phosphoribosylaminoimidazolecarboxamide formyltransferase/IMP cyclohydrolase